MTLPPRWPPVPASYFSVILGLTGLGSAWRRAHQVWGYPFIVAEIVLTLAGIIWAYLLIGYVVKWVCWRDAALEETRDPVHCCFVGLVGVATMLIAGATLPYHRSIAWVLMAAGSAFTVGFGVWRTGGMWASERDDSATTAVLYLPTVAGGFVCAILLASLGYKDWGQLTFGAALFSWLAIESVLLRRLYIGPDMPPALRPTMGIQLAPPAVGLVAYLSVSDGPPGVVSHALLGYALLQALVLLLRVRWVAQQHFAPSYWAFSFGVTALAQAPLIMVSRGGSAPASILASWLFGFANLIVGLLLIGTLRLIYSSIFLLNRNIKTT